MLGHKLLPAHVHHNCYSRTLSSTICRVLYEINDFADDQYTNNPFFLAVELFYLYLKRKTARSDDVDIPYHQGRLDL